MLGLAALFTTTAAGCFGRFRLTNAVYDFNKSASPSPVVRSLLMFAMILIPVYPVSLFVDWVFVNTIDFINGTNQVAVKTLPDGTKLEMAKLDADTVRVRHVDAQGEERSFDLVRVGPKAGYVRAADGRIVGSAEQLADGRIIQQAQ
ncbi:MAG TPA: DUF3332 family protein [Polyangia bacterium]|nr:DUF3332 family protein [Polyangia bacterium]